MDSKGSNRPIWWGFVLAIVLVALAGAVRLWPLHYLGTSVVYTTFYPAVVIAALYGGISAGLAATFFSCLAVFFAGPAFYGESVTKDFADWLGVAVFVVNCTLISGISEAMRRSRSRAIQAQLDLKRSNAELKEARDTLEDEVTRRTAELAQTNASLEKELTERKKVEEALRESEQRLRLFIEHAPTALAMFDREMRYLAVSQRWLKDYCLGPGDIIGRSYYDIFPEIPERWKEVHQRGLEGEVVRADEDRFERTGGGSQWVRWEVRPWYTADGVIGGIVIFTEDITERKRAEEKLHTALRRFYSILSNQYAGLLLVAEEGRIEFANQEFCDQFELQVPPSALQGLTPRDVIGQIQHVYEDPTRAVNRIREIVRDQQPVKSEEIAIRGGKTYLRDFIPIRIDGRPYGRLWHHRDITERKLAEEKLRKSEERNRFLANVIQFSSQPFGVGRMDGSFGMANKAYCDLVGYTEEEMRHIDWARDLTPPEYRELESAKLADLIATGKAVRYEKEYIRKDGTRVPVELLVHTVTNETGERLYYSFVTDLMERKQAEQKLARAYAELEQRVLDRTTELKAANDLLAKEVEERKRSEEALQKWGQIFEHAQWGIVVGSPDVQSLELMNPAFAEMHGYTVEELTGKPILDLFPREERARVPEETAIAHHTGHHRTESKHIRKDGTIFPVLIDMTAVKDEKGKVLYRVVNVLDITERKRAEEELASAAKEIEDLYNNAPCGYHSLDSDGVFIRINNTEISWLGYKREEIIGKKRFQDVITSEGLKTFRENYPAFMTRGSIAEIEYDMVRKDGTKLPVLLSATTVKDSSGNFVMSRGTIFDISRRRRAEDRLRESENRYRQMFENNRAVKLLIDPKSSEIVDANQAASEFYGYGLDRLKQMKMTDINLLPAEEIFQRMSEAYAEQKDYFQFQHGLASGETRYVEVYSSPIELNGKSLLYSIVHDITDRHKAEEELIRSNQDLQQFAYVASHDLQEPLRNVASCLQLLEKKYKNKLDGEADQLMHYAVDSSVRMKALILDLLTYSRIATKGKPPQPVDCEELLDRTVENLRSSIIDAGAVITHDLLPTVSGDDTQLLQVFQNVIGNAIKFQRDDPPQIHVSAVKNKNEWIFSVKDNGIGIESRHLDRIFVIFQRLNKRSQYDGTGMGLAIVKKVVERHGGRVWVESEPGQGTIFYFTIPDKGNPT
jgi:PAS domain S-box-containing protein